MHTLINNEVAKEPININVKGRGISGESNQH